MTLPQRSPGTLAERPTLLLTVVCLAQFMVILDVSIVNVALPSIRDGLHFSTTGLQWVVNAYTITFAGLLMLGGRLADLLGRRRVFLAGTAMFALSSLVCAVSSSQGVLIGARALQGVAGAVSSPATLSIITATLPAGPARNRGLALWGAMGALGGSSGALLGGVLTQGVGWPAIFAVNLPVGAVVVGLGLRVIPTMAPRAEPGRRRHFDLSGALLITLGLTAVTFGIVRTDTLGWGSAGVLGPLAAGVAMVAGFVWVEARLAARPLVPLSIFRAPRLAAANVVVLLMYAANFPAWFFITLYLQQVLHFDAIEAGLCFLPMTGSIFLASTLAPRLVERLGARRLIVIGMLAMTGGMLWLRGIAPGETYAGAVLGGAVAISLGLGFSLVPATIVAMQGIPSRLSGLASGLLNSSRLMGGALGLAVLATMAAAQTRGEHGVAAASAQTGGFDVAFGIAAAFALAAALTALMGLGERRAAASALEEEAAGVAEAEADEPALAA